ncbi:MAG: hypothetical protein IJM72_04600, partial [Deltaproteobacteria bacterium]|nr:hypothetical protein [Deltaproteobacteria bacterium]
MSDVKLVRPASSSAFTVKAGKEDTFALEFDSSEASISRDGNALVFTFEDGGKIVVEDFYEVYNKDSLPTFVMGDSSFSAEEFFRALDAEELMPAEGPAARTAVLAGGGHFRVWGNADLADGLDKLDGLGYSFSPETEADDNRESSEQVIQLTSDDETLAIKPDGLSFTTQDADVLTGNGTDIQAIPEGYTLTQGAVDAVNATIDYGQFSLEGGNLVFTQTEVYSHAADEDAHTFETVSFDVTDANGNATTLDVTVTIEDDEPAIDVTNPDSPLDSGTSYLEGSWT